MRHKHICVRVFATTRHICPNIMHFVCRRHPLVSKDATANARVRAHHAAPHTQAITGCGADAACIHIIARQSADEWQDVHEPLPLNPASLNIIVIKVPSGACCQLCRQSWTHIGLAFCMRMDKPDGPLWPVLAGAPCSTDKVSEMWSAMSDGG